MSRLPPPPAPPTAPPTPSFPLIAVLAPLGGALAIGALTGSPYVLVFAVLSPVIAVASMLDGRRTARRQARADATRFDEECRAYERAIVAAHREERAEQDARHPARPRATETSQDEQTPVRVGVARLRSTRAPEVTASSAGQPARAADDERSAALRECAQWHPALPVLVPRGPIEVRGTGAAARAMRERLSLEPGVTVLDPAAPGGDAARSGEGPCTVIEVGSATRLRVVRPDGVVIDGRPEFWSEPERARRRGSLESATARIPHLVAWRDLYGEESAPTEILIGVGESGTIALDPALDGPHVLVGGTTGSGKSEFLRTLVLSWAHHASPAELALLFVDFKGGASFPDLAELPHALEVITDLDEAIAARALSSLTAEIRRRERWLRDRGARDVRDDSAALGRLVIIIDEYAALLTSLPDLHGVIMDIAARGRSLGIHLVLCTQHPASAVRDVIAANCSIRLSFRIAEDADAAMFGPSHAGRLRALPRGRALLSDAGGVREVQTALIDGNDVRRVRDRYGEVTGAASPWVPPLPTRVSPDDLEQYRAHPRGQTGWAFGLEDRPERQARALAVWHPPTDGALAVIGAYGSGRTTALAAVAEAARLDGIRPHTLAAGWADAVATLRACATRAPVRTLLIADDLDALVRQAGHDRAELLRWWDDAARALREGGGSVVAALAPGPSQHGLLTGRFPSLLELRGARADAPTSANAITPRGETDPPGRGLWRGSAVQVAMAPPLPAAQPPAVPAVIVDTAYPIVVVTHQPRRLTELLRCAHPDAVVLSAADAATTQPRSVSLEPRILLDDVETWTTHWSTLQALRRTAVVVLVGLGPPEVRALLGPREQPPPLGSGEEEVWMLAPEEPLVRARWAALVRDDAPENRP